MRTNAPKPLVTREVSDLLEACDCAVCGSSRQRVVYPATRTAFDLDALRREFSSSGGIPLCDQLVACEDCGLRYISPRLRTEIMVQSYAAGDDERFVSQNPSRIRNFGLELDKLRSRGFLAGCQTVFDIGTAGGAFLKACSDRGLTPDGCEPNRWLCDWVKGAYGITVRPGILSEQLPLDTRYDLITLWDVLEHIADPGTVLRQAATIARPGSTLLLTFPDISRLLARVLGRRWSYLSTVHLWYFTPETIRRLLPACGFRVRWIGPYFSRLELGYLCGRAQETIPGLRVLEGLIRVTGLSRVEAPFFIGQSLVVAEFEGRDNRG